MKKTIVEGFEFRVSEINFKSDMWDAWTLQGRRVQMGRGYDVEMRLEATIPHEEGDELMSALKDGRAVIVIKR